MCSAEDAKWDAYPDLKASFFPPLTSTRSGPTDSSWFYMTYQDMLHNFNTVSCLD